MKKITLLVVAVLISASGFSQEIDLGIKAGVNFASINGVENADAKSITGFQAGVFAGLKLGDKIGLQADILYSKQGAKITSGGIETKFDLSYANIPIVLKYYIFQGLNIQAGPQFGFKVDDNIKDIVGAAAAVEAKTTDISGVVGLGFDLPMGLRVDGRYNFGLSDVLKDISPGQTYSVKWKNTVISLAVGYSFL